MKHHRFGLLALLLFLAAAAAAFADNTTSSTAQQSPSTDQSPAPAAQSVRLPNYFYKRFQGTIGSDTHIVVNLMKLGGQARGDYYDAANGIPIFFGYGSTITSNGSVHLEAGGDITVSGAAAVTGTFDGAFVSSSELSGSWSASASGITMPFVLKESYASGAREFDMSHAQKGYYDHARGSAEIQFSYPVMEPHGEGIAQSFNDYEASSMAGLYENGVNEAPPSTVDAAMSQFLSLFQDQLSSPGQSSRTYFPPWDYEVSSEILLNRSGILSLENTAFSFEGGAHPNTAFRYASYDEATGSVIALSDILKPGSTARLNKVGLAMFRVEHGIPEGKGLAEAGYFVHDADFALNDNFLIVRGGLLFRFSQYEIAPYAWGAPRVFIPFNKIRDLLASNTPISPLLGR